MYVAFRQDIEIPYAKAIVQGGHAFTNVLERARNEDPFRHAYYMTSTAHPKIVVGAKNEAALRRAQAELEAAHIMTYLVTDAGRTVFQEPTVTCLAYGPVRRSQLPKFVGRFQLL